MDAIKIFLLLCQIQGGELAHCSPPTGQMNAITPSGWKPPGPTWQTEWSTWEGCAGEASRRNSHPRQGTNWAFMCYAVPATDIKAAPARPAPELWRRASDGEQ
jgi:hypothetical protein